MQGDPSSKRERGRLVPGHALGIGISVTCLLFACEGSLGGQGDDGPKVEGSGGKGASSQYAASESVARRHSRAELDNTLRDVFGDDSRPAALRLSEDSFDPFDNNYEIQVASAALIDSLEALAEDVAARVLADTTLRKNIVPCTPSNDGDADCFREVIESLGQKAFRRPLREEEIEAYVTLLAFATEQNEFVDNDFYTAVDLFIRSIVQDPEFLYRIEIGASTEDEGVSALDSYEIATRMSYLIWGSSPDAELLSLAKSDKLKQADEREAAAMRMMKDDRARAQIHRFHGMWLGYRAIPHPASLVAEFNQETTQLLDRVIFEDESSYLDVFTSDTTYLSSELAEHYGFPAPDKSPDWVSYGDSGRAGILSHGSVLSGFGKFSDTSPTQRGIFVQTRLMCNVIAAPPANVDVDQPPGDQDAQCKEERYAEHRESPSCATCHNQMDPIGLGLENFDIGGVWRDSDDGDADCKITGEGELPGVGIFSGPAELSRLLVDDGFIDACVVEHYLNFSLGRALQDDEAQLTTDTALSFETGDFNFQRMIVDYVASDAFALRREPR